MARRAYWKGYLLYGALAFVELRGPGASGFKPNRSALSCSSSLAPALSPGVALTPQPDVPPGATSP